MSKSDNFVFALSLLLPFTIFASYRVGSDMPNLKTSFSHLLLRLPFIIFADKQKQLNNYGTTV